MLLADLGHLAGSKNSLEILRQELSKTCVSKKVEEHFVFRDELVTSFYNLRLPRSEPN